MSDADVAKKAAKEARIEAFLDAAAAAQAASDYDADLAQKHPEQAAIHMAAANRAKSIANTLAVQAEILRRRD